MSARGARSRKAVAKDIEKKDKKAAVKGKAPESAPHRQDTFPEWRPTPSQSSGAIAPSRSMNVSSDLSQITSRSSSSNPTDSKPRLTTIITNDSLDARNLPRPRTSASGSASVSGSSTGGQDKTKYHTKTGKESKAPRGRGGGVPQKRPAVNSPPPTPLFRGEINSSPLQPGQRTWMDFRVWEGGDTIIRPYAGFDYDEDMQTGNVLIFFKEEQTSEDRPRPQLRCDLDILENCGSTWLSNALLYGRIDDNEDEWVLPDRPESSIPMHSFHGRNPPQTSGQRRMLAPTSPGGMSPPPFDIDQQYFGVPRSATPSQAQYSPQEGRMRHPNSPAPFYQPAEVQPTHELWFTAPGRCKTPQEQRLHHVAIRNFLAMLHNKPIVGADLLEMLTTLQPEIQVMYDLDQDRESRTPRERSVQMITNYLSERKLDDVRNNIKTALNLLSWAEQDNVKWRQGYLESFVHLAGIMTPQVEDLPEFKRLSIVTRRNLDIAVKTLQLHVMEAEEKLAHFDFGDMWGDDPKIMAGPIYQSYATFRQFLSKHYQQIYGNWPPTSGKAWLNRKIVLALQEDFGTLYDYLVNRDVVWDSREERPGKKWQMINKKTEDFRADGPELSLTDMLVTFDYKHGYQHIPHSYPLLPRSVPQAKPAQKKSLFSSLKKSKTADVTQDAKAHLQLAIVFSDATNIERMDSSFNGSTLIDVFERFELSSDLQKATPRDARLGRWILLYGILQVLSTLSVDVHDLRYTDGVRYFLCTDLKRCPEWVTNGQADYMEASQIKSWCWQRPWGPTHIDTAPMHAAELEGYSVPMGEELGPRTPPPTTPLPPLPPAPHPSAAMLDGTTMLSQDIRRIGEKIDHMHVSTRQPQLYDRRNDNEKMKKDDSFRLTESDYIQRPPAVPERHPLRDSLRGPPLRSPIRSRFGQGQGADGHAQDYGEQLGGYEQDDRGGWV